MGFSALEPCSSGSRKPLCCAADRWIGARSRLLFPGREMTAISSDDACVAV